MDAKTKELLGELEAVAKGLDTAPAAYRVHWSPDSKHVGICSREERHYADNVIYRIENRQAYVVESPELRCHAVPDFCRLEDKLTKEENAAKKTGSKRTRFGKCCKTPGAPKSKNGFRRHGSLSSRNSSSR